MNASLLTIPGKVVDPFELCETFNAKMVSSSYALSAFVFLGLLFYVGVLPFLLSAVKEGNFKSWIVYLGKVFLSVLFVCAGLLFLIINGGSLV